MDDYNNDVPEDNETEEMTTAAEVIQKLEEAWVNEKLSPELLQYEGELVDCMLDQIQYMEISLQKIQKEDFRIVFHKMELDRIKYVLSSYLRIRLEKIEKFGPDLLHQESQEQNMMALMSDEERTFAHKFTTSIKNYLNDVALKNMPSNMRSVKLEDICCKPQMDKSVFIKVKTDVPGVTIESFSEYREEEIVDLTAGSQHILRYKPIAPLLKNGSVQLI
ncbi:DNA replication complex GINS protein SLD5 [Trichonephila clavata]|uniref:DNA replication complex GINS protein SLD5 n=1 Tax=Trichonephila clavata TaxID=2740835 RepID=A0A8X6INU7_TRICU|nr:DNA replication complex GINS protein SLD5 [Trichonephila clavata]